MVSCSGLRWPLAVDPHQSNSGVTDSVDNAPHGQPEDDPAYPGFGPPSGHPVRTRVEALRARVDDGIVPMRDPPTSRALRQDKRQAILARRTGTPSGGVKGPTFNRMTAVAAPGAISAMWRRSISMPSSGRTCGETRRGRRRPRPSRPMHADDIDPLGVVVEQLRQRSMSCRFHASQYPFATSRIASSSAAIVETACSSSWAPPPPQMI